MSRLARYVGVTVLSAMAIVLVLLLGLDVVFSFLGELEDLRDNYQAVQAFTYVLMTLPLRLYDMISVSALIGGIVGYTVGNIRGYSDGLKKSRELQQEVFNEITRAYACRKSRDTSESQCNDKQG